tara:strand:+ start:7357 stop:8400 length:1044 start_codon:yes stop_codon:yes gene_type:complete
MKRRLFPLLIAISALSVSASAALYSVLGLSKLFAGASIEVMIMAGTLEVAKLIVASLLYQYWDIINKWLRSYLVLAVFILMAITSGGIYGFLSGAFQETSTQSELLDKQVQIIDAKRIRFIESRDDYKLIVKELTTSLANPTMIQYVDRESGQLVTTTSSRVRKLKQSELSEAKLNLSSVTDSIALYDTKILEQQIGNESARELGPLKYMSQLTEQPMESIVNWFMLLIIFVFDPLAIAMVIAANVAFAQIKTTTKFEMSNITQEEVFSILNTEDDVEEVVMSKPDGLEFNTPYTMDEVISAFPEDVQSSIVEEKTLQGDIYGEKGLKDLQIERDKLTKRIKNYGRI